MTPAQAQANLTTAQNRLNRWINDPAYRLNNPWHAEWLINQVSEAKAQLAQATRSHQ
jgi:hypothetical protein